MIHVYIAIGLVVVAIIVALFGKRSGGRANAYGQYVEASKASELADGVPSYFGGNVAVPSGTEALVAPYSGEKCVYYSFVLEQEEEVRDADGTVNTQWRQVASQPATSVTFALQAGSDEVLVDATNADVHKPQRYEGLVNPAEFAGGGKLAKFASIMNSLSGRRVRVREDYIPLGQQLYAGGVATEKGGKKVFANDSHYPLVLTPQSKADLVKSEHRGSVIEYVVAVVLIGAAVVVYGLLKK